MLTLLLSALQAIGSLFSLANLKTYFTFLLTNWKEVLIVSIIFLLLYQIFSPVQFFFGMPTLPAQEAKVQQARAQMLSVNNELITCGARNKQLAIQLKEQNNQVQQMYKLFNGLDTSTQNLIKQIQQNETQTQTTVANILNAPTPTTCADAFNFINNEIQNGALKWSK